MAVLPVTSRQHAFIRRCRSTAAGRAEPGIVLLDGEHLVADALAAAVPLEGLLTDGRAVALATAAEARGVPVFAGDDDVLAAASPVRTSSGVVALARWAPLALEALLRVPAPLIVGLANVQDPGNVGGIIRSAEALGATGVAALDETADPGGWKALRGAMGSTFRLPVGRGRVHDLLAIARQQSIPVVATVPAGGAVLGQVPVRRPIIVLFGGEGGGLSDEIVGACQARVTIPMRQGANSLNVGVSAALILWEASRTPARS